MVVRQIGNILSAIVGLQAFHKPIVVGIIESFHALGIGLSVMPARIAPSRSTAATRFLSDGQCHTLIKSTAEESHLSSIRTSGHTDMLGINLRHLGAQLLQSVDESTQSPCPFAVGTIVLQFGIKLVESIVAAACRTAKLRIVVHLTLRESHPGNGTLLEELRGQRDAARANHQRIGSLPHSRIFNGSTQVQRLSVHGDSHFQRVAVHLGLHVIGIHRRLRANLVMLDFLGNLAATHTPVGKRTDSSAAVRPFEGIGQWVHLLSLILCGKHRTGSRSRVFHRIDQRDVVLRPCPRAGHCSKQ